MDANSSAGDRRPSLGAVQPMTATPQEWIPAQAICRVVRRDRGQDPASGQPAPAAQTKLAMAPRPDHLQGIILEPANVLYDDTLWRRWLLKLLTRIGLHTHYDVFFGVWQAEYLPLANRGEQSFEEALRAFLSAVGFAASQVDEVVIAAQAKRNRIEAEHRLLPGVARTLKSLTAAHIPIVVSADAAFTGAELASKLDHLGLAGMFCGVVSSLELKQTKPAVECYQAAVERIGLPAAEVAFVSSRSQHLLGAQEVGMTPIATHIDIAESGIHCVERFEQILDLFPRHFVNRLAG